MDNYVDNTKYQAVNVEKQKCHMDEIEASCVGIVSILVTFSPILFPAFQ